MRKIFQAIIITVLLISSLGIRPVKARSIDNYLDYEAGIAAYFPFTGPTNLKSNLLRNLFRTIQSETDTYLIGFVPVVGLEGYSMMDAKVFVHNSGWVVAYYLGDDRPSAFMLDSFVNDTTRLEKVLAKVANALEVTDYQVSYKNFRHPEATQLLVMETNGVANTTKDFDFRLPGGNTYYERSWYMAVPGLFSSLRFYLDGLLVYWGQSGYYWNSIPSENLVMDAKHVVSVRSSLTNNFFGLAVLYQGDANFTINYADAIRHFDFPPVPQGLVLAAEDVMKFTPFFLPFISR